MIKILTVGNSFSNNATTYLPQMFKSGHNRFKVDRSASLGGHGFDCHLNYVHKYDKDPKDIEGRPYNKGRRKNISLQEILASEKWDFVTIQQVSSKSPDAATFKDAIELYELIKKLAPSAEVLLHETWSYREDSLWLKEHDYTEKQMYDLLHRNYIALAKKLGLRVLPTGAAMQLAINSPEWNLKLSNKDSKTLKPDESMDDFRSLHVGYHWGFDEEDNKEILIFDPNHASNYGCFLGGAVWYEFFCGNVEKNNYCPHGIKRKEAAILRKIAAQAISNYKV